MLFSLLYTTDEVKRTKKGWQAGLCPFCKCVRPLLVVDVESERRLWGVVKTVSEKLSPEGYCHVCDTTVPVPIDSAVSCNWHLGMSIKPLIDATLSGHSEEDETRDYRDLQTDDLTGILRSIQNRVKLATRDSGRLGVMIGFLPGMFLGEYLGILYFTKLPIPWILGAVGGSLLGLLIERLIVSRRFAQVVVLQSMRKHGLSPRDFLEIIRKPGQNFGSISRVVWNVSQRDQPRKL